MVQTLALDKFEALGNDFLVLVDRERESALSGELASALCARHRGVGADGLIRLSESDDGESLCHRAAQRRRHARRDERQRPALRGARRRDAGLTDADVRRSRPATAVAMRRGRRRAAGLAEVRVEMGATRLAEIPRPARDASAFHVDVGNPHLVLIGAAVDDVDLRDRARASSTPSPGGQNVEVVAVTVRDPDRHCRGLGARSRDHRGMRLRVGRGRRGGVVARPRR